MRATAVLLSICTIAAYTANVSAQEEAPRVRVRDTSGTLVTGTLVRVDSAAIVVRTAVINNRGKWVDRDSTIPVTADIRLDRSVGRRSNGGKGALIGLGTGVILGLALGAVAVAGSDDSDGGAAPLVGLGAAFTGGIGALIGYGIGSASKRDIWAEVPLDLPPPGEVTEGGVRLGLRINF